jgi:hypothetical protein
MCTNTVYKKLFLLLVSVSYLSLIFISSFLLLIIVAEYIAFLMEFNSRP